LKYVDHYDSITYKKHGYGFEVNVGNATIRLQGCKGWFKVYGIEQIAELKKIDPDYELATATLVKVSDGNYHIHITSYVNKQKLINYRKSKLEKKKYVKPGEEIVGIDFGCETNFTLSNGKKFNFLVEETERHRSLQKHLKRCKYDSNNYWKIRLKL
jgi:transposase